MSEERTSSKTRV